MRHFDIIVVGAGPAGSVAARYAADMGVSVLIIEKDSQPGFPVRCGEAVNRKRLEEFILPDARWISAVINKFSLNSPDGTEVILRFDEEGYILDREIFDNVLAQMAVRSGAELMTDTYVYDLIIEEGIVKGVKAESGGEKFDISAEIVIAADGVESRVGRFAGLSTFTDYRDMECCVQVTASGLADIDESTCYFHFGKDFAPGGYLWIFPKGEKKANIGLGISGNEGKRRSADSYLNEFIDARYPGIKKMKKTAGGVPCTPTLKKITSAGLMLTGDAARQVNPLSGGGISSGMTAGSIAGRIAAESVLGKKPGHIYTYDKEWYERMGKRHEIYNRLKNGIHKFDDEKLNSIAHSFQKVPVDKRTLGRLFTTALINNPLLLVDVAKVFVI
jgi:digeranylgeranylglycerophospholipid reductase